jgi:putative tryptophan/tyrosine transport system substrate-binding protein
MTIRSMNRRDFITLFGGAAAAWPLAARAQSDNRVRRIGVLFPNAEGDPESRRRVISLQESLAKLGWIDGRNIRIDYRWGAGEPERVQAIIAELLAQPVDVILTNSQLAVIAGQRATRSVPIVFMGIFGPVEQSIVPSLAQPGGNITGFTNAELTVGTKSLELLKEVAPRITRVAFVFTADNPGPMRASGLAAAAAPKLAVEPLIVPVRGPAEIEAALTRIGRDPGGGLVFPPDGFMNTYRKLIIELAARNGLPAIYANRNFVDEGGLAYYGINIDYQFPLAAAYVDRIFKGTKPGDLPVQQPTKYEFVINLKTAKALGLDISPVLLSVADELIE